MNLLPEPPDPDDKSLLTGSHLGLGIVLAYTAFGGHDNDEARETALRFLLPQATALADQCEAFAVAYPGTDLTLMMRRACARLRELDDMS